MHAVGMRGVVLEDDLDGVADFGAQDGTEDAGGLPLCRPGLKVGKGFVGIFVIQRFAIDTPNAMRAALDKDFRVALELHAHHLVNATRGVTPSSLRPRQCNTCELSLAGSARNKRESTTGVRRVRFV